MNEYAFDHRAGYATMGLERLSTMSGLDYLQACVAEDLPAAPISEIVPLKLVEAEKGRVLWRTRPTPYLLNPMSGVHGGYYMTVLDSALACAVQSELPQGRAYTTLEMKVNLTRPCLADGTIYRLEGRAIKVGRRIGIAEGDIRDDAGQLYAHATTTCLIFDAESGP